MNEERTMIDPQSLVMTPENEQNSPRRELGCSVPEVTIDTLKRQNAIFCDTGGVSNNNQAMGFQSAFLDQETGRIYPSCYANGQPAPLHLLDGLPDELVLRRNAAGRTVAVKHTVIAGFVFAGIFYTREQAAQLIAGV